MHRKLDNYKRKKVNEPDFPKKFRNFFYKQFYVKKQQNTRFFGIFSKTALRNVPISHIQIVLIIIYNFSIGAKVRKWLFLDLTASICAKMIFLKKCSRQRLQTLQKCSSDHYVQLLSRLYGDFCILAAVKSKKLRFLI